MSCLASTLISCATIQDDLFNYFQACGAPLIREPFPFAEFLANDVNNRGLSQKIAPGGGKKRSVELIYTARLNESEVTENQADLCSCDNDSGNCSQVYDIDPDMNLSTCERIPETKLRDICKPNSDYIMERIAYRMDVLERRIATELTQQASFLAGEWNMTEGLNVNAGSQLVVKTKKDGDAFTLNPYTMQDIDFAARATGYCGNKVIFAGSELFKYYEAMKEGCCADSGIDLGGMLNRFGTVVLYDPRVAATFPGGSNVGVMTQAGALALLTWNQFGWDAGMPLPFREGANYSRTLMITPRLNIPVDVIIKDECPGILTFTMSAVVKLVNMPNDIFPVGDKYRGVNFFNEILVENA